MTDVYTKAKAERHSLLAQLSKIDGFIAMYEELAGIDAENPPAHRTHVVTAGGWASAVNKAQQRASKRVTIESAAVKLLTEQQPLTTEALLSRIKEMGIEVGGSDEPVLLSSYLSKSDLFKHRRKDGGWFLEAANEKAHQDQLPDLDGPST